MKLLILGATGATGLQVVTQAVERGHTVTAFVRNTGPLETFGDRITVVRGNLLDPAELAGALTGQEAVLSAFGPRLPISKADADLLQRFAVALTRGMQKAGVRRVVIESTAFLFKDAIFPPAYLFGRLFFPVVLRDAGEMESIVAKSGLDWTLVRPPQLTNKPATGKYRTTIGHLPPFGFNIARADVADFMIKAGENHASIQKIVGLAN
ncbi:MAG: SDR family oxidoreductase [Verrucomicrobia bacterium]|nr:SDR family oxidoreductase [Verrucomicrobiota bacterium]